MLIIGKEVWFFYKRKEGLSMWLYIYNVFVYDNVMLLLWYFDKVVNVGSFV